jgi:hypothetical protein
MPKSQQFWVQIQRIRRHRGIWGAADEAVLIKKIQVINGWKKIKIQQKINPNKRFCTEKNDEDTVLHVGNFIFKCWGAFSHVYFVCKSREGRRHQNLLVKKSVNMMIMLIASDTFYHM